MEYKICIPITLDSLFFEEYNAFFLINNITYKKE